MNDGRGRDMGQLAIAVGVVAAGSAVCLATFYAVRGPFGTINDIGNAATGVLSGLLAWRLRGQLSGSSGAVVGSALVGAAIAVVGSALVVSETTGFFLAGLVSGVGFAGIGVWLVALNRSAFAVAAWPARIRALGVAAGVLMAFGVLSVPGIVLRLDDMATAPGWVWLGFVGWFGTFVVYPAWAIWLGVAEARRADLAVQSPLTPTA